MKINPRAAVVREAVKAIVPILSGNQVRVTQVGMGAYVRYDPITGKPTVVNIPCIADDASDYFISAIQGFLDHEVAHIIFTEFDDLNEASKRGSDFKQFFNMVEDARIEKKMAGRFRGSIANLNTTGEFFLKEIIEPDLKKAPDADTRGRLLICPAIRALSGQRIFQEWMSDKWQELKPLTDRLGSDIGDILSKVDTSQDAMRATEIIIKRLKSSQPPQQQPQPNPQPQEQQEQGEKQEQQQSQPQQDEQEEQDQDQQSEPSDSQDKEQGDSESETKDDKKKGKKGKKGKKEEPEPEPEPEPEQSEADAEKGDEEEGATNDSDSSEGEDQDEAQEGDQGDEESAEDGDSDDTEEGDQDDGNDGEAEGEADSESDEESDGEDADEGDSGSTESGSDDADGEPEPGPVDPQFLPTKADFDKALSDKLTDLSVESAADSDYPIFTTDYDLVTPVNTDNCDQSWVTAMTDKVDRLAGTMQKQIERAMSAKSMTVWTGGHQSGRLHSASLTRLRMGRTDVFRRKVENNSKSVAVGLLIDCSGSMLGGGKCENAAYSAYALGTVLERIKIPHEILGFSTTNIPNEMEETYRKEVSKFLDEGKEPPRYGRIEPISTLIVKQFSEQLNPEVKRRLACISEGHEWRQREKEGERSVIFNSNVDGESVMIGARRLLSRKEARKVLIVLSDGMPAACGDMRRLTRHTVEAVKMVEKTGVDVVGIGIKSRSVEKFYKKHIVLNDVSELTGEVLGQLRKLLMPTS